MEFVSQTQPESLLLSFLQNEQDNQHQSTSDTAEKKEPDHPFQEVLDTTDINTHLPLHRFSHQDLGYCITRWVCDDINYKLHLSKITEIFIKHELSGSKMKFLSKHNFKDIVRKDLMSFFTEETLDIMFDCFQKYNTNHPQIVKSKSAEQISHILYNYPLRNLLERINSNKIDGKQFIEYLIKNNVDIIAEETGWKQNEVHQMHCMLFRYHTFTELEFKLNMDHILHTQYAVLLPKDVVNQIKEIPLQFDVEELHYKIKNAQNIEEFSDYIINTVDEMITRQNNTEYDEEDLVRRIYQCIAECFIFNHQSSDNLCSKLQHWICNNCSNCNVNVVIDSKPTETRTVCTLCGIQEREQIILKLRHHDSYIMVNDVNKEYADDDDKHSDDDIDKLIQDAISSDGSFNLLCPSQNNQHNCVSLLRLANILIKYKRWIHTIYMKTHGNDDIDKTVKVDISKFIDDVVFRNVFIQSIASIELLTETQMKLITKLMDDNIDDIGNIQRFLKTNKAAFSKTLQKHANTKASFGSKLYLAVSKALKQRATQQNIDINTINNGTFKIILIECAESIQKQSTALTTMLDGNIDNIADIKAFVNSRRQDFAKTIQQNTKTPISIGAKLFTKIKQSLKQKAHTKQFGEFLSDLDIETILKDYQHILKMHIYRGNKMSIKNSFRFFEYVVHFEDSETEKNECRSYKRREDQANDLNTDSKEDNSSNIGSFEHHKDIWTLKQYHIQSQLDIIHSYLVHSKWQNALARYSSKHSYDGDDNDIDEFKNYNYDEDQVHNTSKYVTDLNKADTSKYVFGIDHSHPYLKPKYDSIHDELLLNKLYCLSQRLFQSKLIKAIKYHIVTLDEYKDEFICKYYQQQYNIIRNEPIGLRHIFAIIVYTDISNFCTIYRETYRIINNESIEAVTERHQQLYYYARALYETVEFFGQYLDPNLKIYHGLNRVLYFSKFTAYFNQPISTTTQFRIAHQFTKGSGIVLTLRAATQYLNDPTKKVKYLSVAELSNFPNEEEFFFYGKYVVFKICNIYNIEDNQLKDHSVELLLLNTFQNMVQSEQPEEVKWHQIKQNIIEALAMMIRQRHNKFNEYKPSESKYLTPFSISLFNYFCDNQHIICIKNFESLPSSLHDILFYDIDPDTNKKLISLVPIIKLFKHLREVILNELDIELITGKANQYVAAVLHYIKQTDRISVIDLEKIALKSEVQNDGKENSPLKNLANKYSEIFKQYKWQIRYELSVESTHNLLFTNDNTSTLPTGIKNTISITQSKHSTKHDIMPTYFIQITSVDEDEFHIEVLTDTNANDIKKLYIKIVNGNTNEFQRVKIEKHKLSIGADVDIDEKDDECYHLALYQSKKSPEPIPNSTKLKLTILTGKKNLPPHNIHYKPNPIVLSNVFQVKNVQNNKLNIYWIIPPKSFGNISYKIIKDYNKNKEEIISLLPYSIDFSLLPMLHSFRVITISKVDDHVYESNASEPIVVEKIVDSLCFV